MNFLSKENADRWYHLAWWLCLVSMPWFDALNSACIFALLVMTILHRGFVSRLNKLKENRWAWPFFAYYVLLVVGVFYTPDINNGISTLVQKLAFIVLPLVAITGKTLERSTIRFLKFSFVYSCVIVIVVSLFMAAFRFSPSTDVSNFDLSTTTNYNTLHAGASSLWMRLSYIQILKWADLHPGYFSMYLIFCLVILFTEKSNSRTERIFHFAIGVMVAGFIAMLASRAAIIALVLAVIFLMSRRQPQPAFQILASSSVVALLLWFNPVARFRIVEEPLSTTYEVDPSVSQWNSVSYRLLEWQGSMSIINSHLLFGVGTSGWKPAMGSFYSHFNTSTAGLTYNSHNQFLQTWMENGFVGLLVLSLCIFGSLFRPQVDPSYVVFVLLFSVMCMTESILDRQKGIIFFTVFQSLFLAFKNKLQ